MNAEVIEIVWVLLAVGGSVYTGLVMRDAYRDRQTVLRERLDSVAELHTRADLWHEVRRFFAQLLLVTVGLIAMFLPPSLDERTAGQWAAVVILIVFNAIFTYNSYATLQTRKQSLALLRKQANGTT